MTEIQPQHHEIAESVRKLLTTFHEDTHSKLALAPVDSPRIYQRADGRLYAVHEDGWPTDYDEPDRTDTITVEPTSIRDIEEP